MFKKLFAVLAMLVAPVIFTGCDSSKQPPSAAAMMGLPEDIYVRGLEDTENGPVIADLEASIVTTALTSEKGVVKAKAQTRIEREEAHQRILRGIGTAPMHPPVPLEPNLVPDTYPKVRVDGTRVPPATKNVETPKEEEESEDPALETDYQAGNAKARAKSRKL